jgi:TPR repeat protein
MYSTSFFDSKNLEKSVFWFSKAVQAGDIKSMLCLAHLCYPIDQKSGMFWLQKLAELQDPEGMAMYGTLLMK